MSSKIKASAVVAVIREQFVPRKPDEKEIVAVPEALAEAWEEPVLAFLKNGEDAELVTQSDEWDAFLHGLPSAVRNAT